MPPDEPFRVQAPKDRDSELLRAAAAARPVTVDRKNNVLRGYVVMMAGQLKDRPGEVDGTTLDGIIALANAWSQGVKSRFAHPTECADGLGKYLGRSKDYYLSDVVTRDGRKVAAVRADLHFDATAMDTPPQGGKPLGLYVMDLAESDPDALSSSVVARFKREYRLETDGTRKKDAQTGDDLPPLMRPVALWASDVVDEGAAVDGLFSAGDPPNAHLWQAAELLDGLFPDAARAAVRERLAGYVDRYIELRFGPEEKPALPAPAPAPPPAEPARPELSAYLRRQRLRELEAMG